MKKLRPINDMQRLNVLRQHGFVENFTFWNPINHDARYVVKSQYHRLTKGELEEHRYSHDEIKRWIKQLCVQYPQLRKAIH